MKLVVASNNAHKIAELNAILSRLEMEVVSQREAGVHVEPEETGTTFEENSYIKAKAVLEASGMAAVADDSGLMVEALGGAPGVYSARFGGAECRTDRDRLEYLLKKMEGQENRAAKFVSVITVLTPDGRKLVARGECPGVLLTEPRGDNGFGYDPIFFYPQKGCTFAELPAEEKNKISHRSRALKLLSERIQKEWNHADK